MTSMDRGKRMQPTRTGTRADHLQTLNDRSRESGRQKSLENALWRLNLSGLEGEVSGELTRAEREYLLLCATQYRERDLSLIGASFNGGDYGGVHTGGVRTERRTAVVRPALDTALTGLWVADDPLEVRGLYMRIVMQACDLMQTESALLAMVDDFNGHFTYRAASGMRALSCLGRKQLVEETSICGWVIRQNTFFMSNDVRTDLRGGNEFREILKARTAAAAPLIVDGAVRGALAVADRKDGGGFRRDDIREILVPFAREASLLIKE